MAAVFPSGSNTYVPSPEATGNMQIEFSRNPKAFALPRYVKYVTVDKTTGMYLEIGREEAARILQDNLYDLRWSDGADAPHGNANHEKFEWKGYRTERFAFPYRLGELAVEQASWEILATYGRIHAQRAMTARTVDVMTLIQTGANWPTGHKLTSAITEITGVTGTWDVSTTARSDIKRSIDYAIEQIVLDSLGVVNEEDLQLVVSLGCARKMSESQEIIDYMKGSYVAEQRIRGEGDNVEFVLPARLYNIPVVVERTVKVTSAKGATVAKSYVMADAKPVILARPGGLEGTEGVPSFSAVTMFIYGKDDMAVEEMHDVQNRVHKARIVDHYDTVLTAGVGGFMFAGAVT